MQHDDLLSALDQANAAWTARYPGDRRDRQPLHTVYGGAQRFKADTARRLGELALRALSRDAPDAPTLARALGVPELAPTVYDRVVDKLQREPVEDFRIDFEDGF